MLGSRCFNCSGSGNGTSAAETPNTGVESPTVVVNATGTAGRQIGATVRVSALSGNQLQVQADGLFVPLPASFTAAALRSLFAPSVVAAQVLAVDAAGNLGLATPAAGGSAETPNSGATTSTLRITASGASGRQIGGDVRISAASGNQVQAQSDGLFVPVPTATITPAALVGALNTPITISQVFGVDAAGNPGRGVVSTGSGAETANSGAETPTAKVTAGGALGRQISVAVKVSSVAGNRIQLQSDGMYVSDSATAPSAGTIKAVFASGTAAVNYGEDATGAVVKEPAATQLQRLLVNSTFSFATTSSGSEVNGLQVRVQVPGGTAVNLPGLVIPLEPVRDCNNTLLGYFVKP